MLYLQSEKETMANLNRLMTLGGAVAAGEFSADGGLVSYKGDFPRETARYIATLCAGKALTGAIEVAGLSRITGMDWLPFHGWALSAGDYSICVLGYIGVFVETAKADFNEIYRVLSQEAEVVLKAA
jgi:roadblock/LC7 domain-containing protein